MFYYTKINLIINVLFQDKVKKTQTSKEHLTSIGTIAVIYLTNSITGILHDDPEKLALLSQFPDEKNPSSERLNNLSITTLLSQFPSYLPLTGLPLSPRKAQNITVEMHLTEFYKKEQ